MVGLVLLAVGTMVLAACDPSAVSPGTGKVGTGKPPIKLAVSPWVASELNAALAAIILEEKMGYTVELVPIDEYAQWEALARGEVHASLEIWPSGHGDNAREYIQEKHLVQDGGLLGPVGKIAWYIPSYVLRTHPELATWEGFRQASSAALFATPDSDDKGRFLAGDPTWVQYDEDIIRNLGLNLAVVRLESEDALLAALDEAYKKEEPILLYFWTPHWAHTIYDLVPVKLPDYSDACYARKDQGGVDCDYPPDPLFKAFWVGLEDQAPEAYRFLKNMSYTNLDQIAMLASVQLDGKSVEEAARAWLAENTEVWQAWLP